MTILDQYRALDKDKRNYDHQNWHAVNVKRYNGHVTMTLGSLLSHENDAIKRNAIGIMKQLNKK